MKVTRFEDYGVRVLNPVKGGVHVMMWKENFDKLIEALKESNGALINDLFYEVVNYEIVEESRHSNMIWANLYLVKLHNL